MALLGLHWLSRIIFLGNNTGDHLFQFLVGCGGIAASFATSLPLLIGLAAGPFPFPTIFGCVERRQLFPLVLWKGQKFMMLVITELHTRLTSSRLNAVSCRDGAIK